MNVLEVIVLVMVVTIVVTITLAAMSYGAFRVRERRRPAVAEVEQDGPMFFERVRLPGLVERVEGQGTAREPARSGVGDGPGGDAPADDGHGGDPPAGDAARTD